MLKKQEADTITDSDYADDLKLLINTPALAESLLHSLELATGGIGLYMNATKTDFICFKQVGAISTLRGKSLKLLNQFTYLGSNISSTKGDVNMHLEKA